MISELLDDIFRSRSVHDDRAALLASSQAEIDTMLYHVNASTRLESEKEPTADYGVVGGDDMNNTIDREHRESEQAVVMMKKGWHEFRRDLPGIMPPTLADWLVSIDYARVPTDKEIAESDREDVPMSDPADMGRAARVATRVHHGTEMRGYPGAAL